MAHPTIAQLVTDELRGRILRGDLEPGARLDMDALAEDLDVSRTPLQGAVERLADEGLVEVIPRRGAYVAEPTVQDALEMAQLREALEAFAFRTVASHITDDDLARLTELHQAYHDASVQEDSEAAIRADIAFHDYVIQRSGNERLIHFVRRLSILMVALRVSCRMEPVPFLGTREDHLPLLEALASRDAEVAEAAIRRHIRGTQQDLVRRMHEEPVETASAEPMSAVGG